MLSTAVKGYFCLPCALVYNGQSNDRAKYPSGKYDTLVEKPLTYLKGVTGKRGILDTHPETQYHKGAVASFNAVRTGQTIVEAADRMPKVSPNRESLKKIVQTLYVCCTQNLVIRGHDDQGKVKPLKSDMLPSR